MEAGDVEAKEMVREVEINLREQKEVTDKVNIVKIL